MTGFDGVSLSFHLEKDTRYEDVADYLQFTITSRADMPNAEFAEEIEKAAEELYRLFASFDPASGAHSSGSQGLGFSSKL